jgi:hypothetical protein
MTWSRAHGPSAGLVQQHFVKSRLAELHRTKPQVVEKVLDVIRNHPLLKHMKLEGGKLIAAYDKINKALQAADLTINFSSSSWFATENRYDSYTQMYERNIQADGTAPLIANAANSVRERAWADDGVTFPGCKPIVNAGKFSHAGPAFTPGVTAAEPRRTTGQGVRPGVQSMDRLMKQMRFGEGEDKKVNGVDALVSKNPYFNPHTKQVFAALNYGRRPQGSCTSYGKSFLLLNPQLKAKALYFGQDTFFVAARQVGAEAQVPYSHLATILAAPGTRSEIVEDIIKSCYFGMSLPDHSDPAADSPRMLEGHIFSALPFKGNLAAVVIPLDEKHTVYGENARKFAARHGAKMEYTYLLKK